MAQLSRPRHVKHRTFGRLRHASSNFRAWLTVQGARLLASASGRTFTAEADDDICTATAHGFLTGKGPIVVSNSGGALPTGLAAATFYWPIKLTADTFKLATTRENAVAGTAIDLTTDGTGTQTAKYSATAAAMLERLRLGADYTTILAEDDIDDL